MKPIFRNSMFGFHKEDVASFIAKQSSHYEKKISDLETKLENTERAFELEKQGLISDREELESLRSQKKKFYSDLDSILALSDEIDLKNEKILTSCENNKIIAGELENSINLLNHQVAKAEEFREKAGRFDQLATVLGEIFSGKKNDASINKDVEECAHQCVNTEELHKALVEQKELIDDLMTSYADLVNMLRSLKEKI